MATLNNRVWGMIVSGTAVGTVVEKNNIANIFASSSGAGARVDIITCLQSQTVANGTYSNNMVSTTGGGASSDRAIFGILDLSATPAVSNYYFNSVNITGAATAANNTYAFNRNSTATVTLRDNIFADTRSGGTGFHVAMANTNAAATGWSATASDNNVLFNAVPGNLCQWLGAAVGNNQTLAGWQAVQPGGSGGDAASISVDPLFISPSNLHLSVSPLSPAINAGVAFGGITTDIDGDTRPVGPAFDIGADEVTNTPPTITAVRRCESPAGFASVEFDDRDRERQRNGRGISYRDCDERQSFERRHRLEHRQYGWNCHGRRCRGLHGDERELYRPGERRQPDFNGHPKRDRNGQHCPDIDLQRSFSGI